MVMMNYFPTFGQVFFDDELDRENYCGYLYGLGNTYTSNGNGYTVTDGSQQQQLRVHKCFYLFFFSLVHTTPFVPLTGWPPHTGGPCTTV